MCQKNYKNKSSIPQIDRCGVCGKKIARGHDCVHCNARFYEEEFPRNSDFDTANSLNVVDIEDPYSQAEERHKGF